MIKIALVGDIGSGKSHISKLFKAPIFNADKEVSSIYKKIKVVLRKLKKNYLAISINFLLKKVS